MIKLVLLITSILKTIALNDQINQNRNSIHIQGNVDQFVNINLPFKHVLQAKITQTDLSHELFFSPNKFVFKPIKQTINPQFVNKTILQQLRTPFSNQFTHIFKLRQFVVVFRYPNHFSIFRETSQSFLLTKYEWISQLIGKQLKFKKINDDYIMVFIQTSKILIINEKVKVIIDNTVNSTDIVPVQNFGDKNEYQNLFIYKNQLMVIKNDKIEIVSAFMKKNSIDINKIYQRRRENSIDFWMIDQQKGLFFVNTSVNYNINAQIKSILGLKNIMALDIDESSEQIKLLITYRNMSTIFSKELILNNNKNSPEVLRQSQNIFKQDHILKFQYFDDKIISFERSILNVYFPFKMKDEKNVMKFIQSRSIIPVSGSFAYAIQTNDQGQNLVLYSINNQQITKYNLQIQNYSLQLKFDQQVYQKVRLQVDYICENSHPNSIDKVKNHKSSQSICRQSYDLSLNIHRYVLSYMKLKSIVIGAIFLLSTILVVLIILCNKKYNAIEKNLWTKIKELPSQIKIKQ